MDCRKQMGREEQDPSEETGSRIFFSSRSKPGLLFGTLFITLRVSMIGKEEEGPKEAPKDKFCSSALAQQSLSISDRVKQLKGLA